MREEMCQRKVAGEKLAMLTAYDYPTARLVCEGGADLILVGDSLGMVVLGYPDTTSVTMEDMLHHARAAVRGANQTRVIVDLPIHSYDSPAQAVENARRLMETGAHGVKLEGGTSHRAQIEAIVSAGIPLMGHIGMLPQSVLLEGGYKIKGKTDEQAAALLADARAVEKAGAFAVVMELVKPEVAAQITATLAIPTIGIGSGKECDGQVLVIHDLAGMFPWFTPRFVKPKAQVGLDIRAAVEAFVAEVKC